MANTIKMGDWVGEETSTTGTGAITLGGPLIGFTPFSSYPEGEYWYTLVDGNNRESGSGQFAGNTFDRTSIDAVLINGVFTTNPSQGLTLSGGAQIYCTFNKRVYDTILNDAVTISDPQTITGAKTFNVPVTAPAIPTTNNHLTNKAYVDTAIVASGPDPLLRPDLAANTGAEIVGTASGQTLQWELDNPSFPGDEDWGFVGGIVTDVKDYGSVI